MCVNMVDAGSEGASADQDLGEDLLQSAAVQSNSNNLDSNHTTASSSVGRQQQVSRLHADTYIMQLAGHAVSLGPAWSCLWPAGRGLFCSGFLAALMCAFWHARCTELQAVADQCSA